VFRLFQGLWRYVTLTDLWAIIKATTAGSVLFLLWLLLFYGHGLGGFPRSIIFLDWLLCIIFLLGLRLLSRIYREYRVRRLEPSVMGERTLIIGAGNRGVRLAKEMMLHGALGLKVVGFLDDEFAQFRPSVLGLPVFGAVSDLESIITTRQVTRVIATVPYLPFHEFKSLREICSRNGVIFQRLPSTGQILLNMPLSDQLTNDHQNNSLGLADVQNGSIPFSPDSPWFLEEEVVLVTGAAGSIGSELCRQIANRGCRKLIMLDQNESGLFEINEEFKRCFPELINRCCVADIVEKSRLESLILQERPTTVFHAAAYKHVPLMEEHPLEAISTNVLGTYYLSRLCYKNGVNRFVFISTDKAVGPVSVMGKTKTLGEHIVMSLNGHHCRFSVVRFGNVVNSNGSVVPLFCRQVEEGGPVTVTHPEVTRFFMSIGEAVELVLASSRLSNGGEIFVLDMGDPVKIVDLARQIITKGGFVPDKDIEIKYVGLRKGEKMHEELYWDYEEITDTEIERIQYVKPSVVPLTTVESWSKKLIDVCQQGDERKARELLDEMVNCCVSDDALNDRKVVPS
jgi:FlaA1/EpsC-like NDP-sugar epimerase